MSLYIPIPLWILNLSRISLLITHIPTKRYNPKTTLTATSFMFTKLNFTIRLMLVATHGRKGVLMTGIRHGWLQHFNSTRRATTHPVAIWIEPISYSYWLERNFITRTIKLIPWNWPEPSSFIVPLLSKMKNTRSRYYANLPILAPSSYTLRPMDTEDCRPIYKTPIKSKTFF